MNIDPMTAGADALLQALIVGDLAADEPRVAARLQAEPQLRVRWQQLAATLNELQQLAPLPATGPGETDPAVDTHAAVRTFRAKAASRSWWRVGLTLATAAAALLLLWALRTDPTPTPDPRLGGGNAPAMTPDGTWAIGQPLTWPAVRGAVGYRVQIKTAPDGPVRVLPDAARGDDLFSQPSWLPTAAERDGLPAEFSWRAIAVDGSGQEVGTSAWAMARR